MARTEELPVLDPAALDQEAICPHQFQRLHILHDGSVLQPAPVPVRCQSSPDAQSVCAGLLLHDAPALSSAYLQLAQSPYEVIPEDARLNFHKPALVVQGQDSVQSGGVHQHPAGEELLPTHGVPAARNADAVAGIVGPCQGLLKFRQVDRIFGFDERWRS